MKRNNNLEEKVMRKIYFFETRRTVTEIILKTLILIFLILNLWIFFHIFLSILKEQKSFDLLTLLKEEPEVIRRYFFDNLIIFFWEMPKIYLIVLLFLALLMSSFILYLKKRYAIVKKKVISLINFWRKKI